MNTIFLVVLDGNPLGRCVRFDASTLSYYLDDGQRGVYTAVGSVPERAIDKVADVCAQSAMHVVVYDAFGVN